MRFGRAYREVHVRIIYLFFVFTWNVRAFALLTNLMPYMVIRFNRRRVLLLYSQSQLASIKSNSLHIFTAPHLWAHQSYDFQRFLYLNTPLPTLSRHHGGMSIFELFVMGHIHLFTAQDSDAIVGNFGAAVKIGLSDLFSFHKFHSSVMCDDFITQTTSTAFAKCAIQ